MKNGDRRTERRETRLNKAGKANYTRECVKQKREKKRNKAEKEDETKEINEMKQ